MYDKKTDEAFLWNALLEQVDSTGPASNDVECAMEEFGDHLISHFSAILPQIHLKLIEEIERRVAEIGCDQYAPPFNDEMFRVVFKDVAAEVRAKVVQS